MSDEERTETVALTLAESGVLCHALLAAINKSSGSMADVPPWVFALYDKLCVANDRLMGKKR